MLVKGKDLKYSSQMMHLKKWKDLQNFLLKHELLIFRIIFSNLNRFAQRQNRILQAQINSCKHFLNIFQFFELIKKPF
jgi:hypothetical protein